MSDVPTQSMVVLYWSMLAAGAGLSSLGLFRSYARFRDWRPASQEDAGEIVLGDGRIAVGQSVVVAAPTRDPATDPGSSAAGSITELTRSNCVLTLDDVVHASLPLHGNLGAPLASAGADGSGSYWKRGAQVSVTVTAASELYRFSARIRDVISHSNGIRLVISRPAFLVRIQRRKHARVPLAVPATIEHAWMLPDARGSSAAPIIRTSSPIHGTVRDLSGGGFRAHIGGASGLQQIDTLLKVFQPESTVRVRLPIPTLPDGAVLARIVSSGRAVTSGGLTVAIACEFLPMPPWEQEIVIQHVFQFQREMSKARKMGQYGGQSGLRQ
jgi:c-di-GMP-binding flagellar brake protein YcgR